MPKAIVNQSGIYQILNTVTSIRYIGQSANIQKRKQQHFAALENGKHHCKHMQRAFDKYGASAFHHSVIELCGSDQITKQEQYWMDFFGAIDGIYNSAPAAGSPLGLKRSAETIEKLRLAKVGRMHSDETKRRMSESHIKRKEEQSIKARAQWSNPVMRAAFIENIKGRVVSDETKKKLRSGLLIRWSNEEYKTRVSANQKIAQVKKAGESSERMMKKWADPEFKKAMILARKVAREKIVELSTFG